MSEHAQTQNILMIDHLHDGGVLGAAGRRHQAGVAFAELHHRIHPSAGMSVRLHLAVIFDSFLISCQISTHSNIRISKEITITEKKTPTKKIATPRGKKAINFKVLELIFIPSLHRCSPPSFGGDLQKLPPSQLEPIGCSPPSFGGDLQKEVQMIDTIIWCSPPSFGGDLQMI